MPCTMIKVCPAHGVFFKGAKVPAGTVCPNCGSRGRFLDITCSKANLDLFNRLVEAGQSMLEETA